jgi:hypothetical protein
MPASKNADKDTGLDNIVEDDQHFEYEKSNGENLFIQTPSLSGGMNSKTILSPMQHERMDSK